MFGPKAEAEIRRQFAQSETLAKKVALCNTGRLEQDGCRIRLANDRDATHWVTLPVRMRLYLEGLDT